MVSLAVISKPTIAITYGDEQGIGLEILCQIIRQGILGSFSAHFVIYGDSRLLPHDLGDNCSLVEYPVGCGEHSFEVLQKSATDVLEYGYQGLVTGPISKKKWIESGHKYKGQTELLSTMAECPVEMLFVASPPGINSLKYDWKTVLLTRHVALKDVPRLITFERIESVLKVTQNFYTSRENVALAGLNPHAGEQGEIGKEEILWNQWNQYLGLAGVYSPDDIWYQMSSYYLRAEQSPFELCLAPYHDQVLPLIKSITRLRAVNMTVGMPFIRTSPDHGTAYSLVGTGLADIEPFIEAIRVCLRYVSYATKSSPTGG